MQIGIWAIVMVFMLLLEAATQSIVSIWFAAGALAALLAAALGATVPVQVSVFFFVSGLLLAFLLPYLRRKMEMKRTPTNADRIIGAEGVVTEIIDAIEGTGQIRVMGATWSAVSATGEKLPEGTGIFVKDIQGVRAVVERKENLE